MGIEGLGQCVCVRRWMWVGEGGVGVRRWVWLWGGECGWGEGVVGVRRRVWVWEVDVDVEGGEGVMA